MLLFILCLFFFFFFSSRRRHTRSYGDWSSDVCSSDLDFEVAADIWSVTSFNELHRDGVEVERAHMLAPEQKPKRSEERRVGKECKSRWWPDHEKKKE